MNCPKCKTRPLLATRIRDVEVDRCKSCHGIWCDRNELELLLNQSKWRLGKLTGSKRRDEYNLAKGDCPRDAASLIRVSSVDSPEVVLDSCPECGGLWLDGGELDRLLEARQE